MFPFQMFTSCPKPPGRMLEKSAVNSPLVCSVRLNACLTDDQTRPKKVTDNSQFYLHLTHHFHIQIAHTSIDHVQHIYFTYNTHM